MAAQYSKSDPVQSKKFDRKQLPIKIFINAYFGSLSAPHVFPWGDMDKGETITCVGRQSLRMMIMFFQKKGYKPLVMDTDGVNFSCPPDVDEREYLGKGKNELVVGGKLYKGAEADTAEFNDIFMRNEMGLDIDYVAPSTVNVARKNYVLKKPSGGLKLTGNTIKSKNLHGYIVDFLDESLKLLLDGKGQEFLEVYYSYIEKIFNKDIPLAKIANKARVKQSIPAYLRDMKTTTKSGASKARKAHMELIIKNDYPAGLGETIFYVNNGDRKGDGDVQKITKPTKKFQKEYFEEHGTEVPENYIKINSFMITEKELNDNPDMKGDYNVARYISTFNKRIEPLLVVFHPDIRNEILIEDPKDRPFFTSSQCELVNGYPMKEGHQDDFDEVMTLSDSEVMFWKKVKRDPYFLYLEDSIKHVDPYWVQKNRDAVDFKVVSSPSREGDIIERGGHDFATHTDIS